MTLVYFVSVLLALLGNNAYWRTARGNPGARPMPGSGAEVVWQRSGLVSTLLVVGLVLGGFAVQPWWHPPLAFVGLSFLAGFLRGTWLIRDTAVGVFAAPLAVIATTAWVVMAIRGT